VAFGGGFAPARKIWGGCWPPEGGGPPRPDFLGVSECLSGFCGYAFFDFEGGFSPHPTGQCFEKFLEKFIL